jgi:hypothetical protein
VAKLIGGRKATAALIAVLAIAVAGYVGATRWVASGYDQGAPVCSSGRCDPNGGSAASGGHRLTLDPLLFVGPPRQAYIIAEQNPLLLSQLPCFCGCDKNNGHKNLLDCYRDRHGGSCEICTGEALDANRMFNQGSPVEQIRDALRARYAPRE